jgi:hypothetical protein
MVAITRAWSFSLASHLDDKTVVVDCESLTAAVPSMVLDLGCEIVADASYLKLSFIVAHFAARVGDRIFSRITNAIDRTIVRGAANFIFSSLRIQGGNGKYIGQPIIADATARAEIRPAMRHDRRRIFPMDSPQSRASMRVVKPSPKLNRQPKIKSAKAPKNNYSNFASAGVLAVAVILLALSLSHLAAGITLVTGAGPADGWLMAIGIDLGFIALELAVLVVPADKRAAVVRYAAPAIVGTLAASAAMNAFAFAAHADGLLIYPAIGLGLAIPALIYALTKVTATLWIDAA